MLVKDTPLAPQYQACPTDTRKIMGARTHLCVSSLSKLACSTWTNTPATCSSTILTQSRCSRHRLLLLGSLQ